MSLTLIIDATKAILGAVAGVGPNVHAYERWADDDARFRALFVDGTRPGGPPRVLGWTITRESTRALDRGPRHSEDQHTIVIRAYLGLQDEAGSERTFQELLESVRAAFLSNRRLDGAALHSRPMEARVVEHKSFAGVLCHYAELVLVAEEKVSA